MRHSSLWRLLEQMFEHGLTKADIFFFAGIVAVSLLIVFFQGNRARGAYAEISYDGMPLCRVPLMQEEETYYLIAERQAQNGDAQSKAAEPQNTDIQTGEEKTQMMMWELTKDEDMEWVEAIAQTEAEYKTRDYNIFLCHDGEVEMIAGSCPDLICVHHKPISAAGENIICLPHKIVIAIAGGGEQELDGVIY